MKQQNEFVRVADTNKEELAKLVTLAKGPGKTMKQFADECGVQASALSRIVNQRNKGACSDDLIKTIAEHADPESGVTIDTLMAAHGMTRLLGNDKAEIRPGIEIERLFTETLCYELKKFGDPNPEIFNASFPIGMTYKYNPDFMIRTNAIPKESNPWAFDILPLQNIRSGHDIVRNIIGRIGRIVPLFYCNEADAKAVGKFTYVITDKQCFERIETEFVSYIVPFHMSFIWFDMDGGGIEREFVLRQPGKCTPDSIFSNL